jgi:transcriptional regulator with XRE-family HTH domain
MNRVLPKISQEVLRERLAVKVRALRTKLGLTLKVASARAEMHWRHWQKIEAGEVNVTLQTLIRLGLSLDADPADLISAP